MADQIVAKSESASFTPPPEGQLQAVCVDVIDLGENVEQYLTKPPKIAHKGALVWQLNEENPDTGKRWEVSKEFTISMNEKANLRKILGTWRGKSYTDAEAAEGAPLHKLEGVNCLIQVEHKTSGSGKVYANVISVTSCPKQLPKMSPLHYERSEWWATKKAEYAERVAQFRRSDTPAVAAAKAADAHAAALVGADDDDALPF